MIHLHHRQLGPTTQSRNTRQVYVSVIRSVLTYAASTFTTIENAFGGKKGRGKGIVARFATEQNKCLRTVTGAYRSTPVKALEAEANCAPIGIELAKRAAAFETKMMDGTAWPDAWGRIKRLVASARRTKSRKKDDAARNPMRRWESWRNASPDTIAPTSADERAREEWEDLRDGRLTAEGRIRLGHSQGDIGVSEKAPRAGENGAHWAKSIPFQEECPRS